MFLNLNRAVVLLAAIQHAHHTALASSLAQVPGLGKTCLFLSSPMIFTEKLPGVAGKVNTHQDM